MSSQQLQQDILRRFKGHLSEQLISTISFQHVQYKIEGCTAHDLAEILAKRVNVKSDEEKLALTYVIGSRLSQLRANNKVNSLAKRRGRFVVYYINRPTCYTETTATREEREQEVKKEETGPITGLKAGIQQLDNDQLIEMQRFVNNLVSERFAASVKGLKQALQLIPTENTGE